MMLNRYAKNRMNRIQRAILVLCRASGVPRLKTMETAISATSRIAGTTTSEMLFLSTERQVSPSGQYQPLSIHLGDRLLSGARRSLVST